MSNQNAETVQPLNVLGMAVKPVYLTDPMNAPKDTSTNDGPASDEDDDTPQENPSKGENQDHDWKKRYGDLKSYSDRQLSVLQSQMNDLKAQLNDTQSKLVEEKSVKRQMPKTPEEFKAFSASYPELADMITTAAMMAHESESEVVKSKLKQLEEMSNAARAKEALEQLKQLHPDILEIKEDPKFVNWFHDQPEHVKSLIRSVDVKDIAKGVDLYKYENGLKRTQKEKSEAAREASRSPQVNSKPTFESGSTKIWKDSEVSKMRAEEFAKHEADIRLAVAEGRYLQNQ